MKDPCQQIADRLWNASGDKHRQEGNRRLSPKSDMIAHRRQVDEHKHRAQRQASTNPRALQGYYVTRTVQDRGDEAERCGVRPGIRMGLVGLDVQELRARDGGCAC